MNTTIYDGPPGSGKTTRIVQGAPSLPGRTAICTFTREAARTVTARAPSLTAGTIYSLTWGLVRRFAGKKLRLYKAAAPWQERTISGEFDAALGHYTRTARSLQPLTDADTAAELLHSWDGAGPPPFDLEAAPYGKSLSFLLPMARWLAAGRPGLTEGHRYDNVIVDEAQDMSTLEIAIACSLVAPGGQFICYGDPGQALYMAGKGSGEAVLPPAWTLPGARHELLTGGYRVGEPLASTASRVLRPIWDRPADSFAAPHRTEILPWWGDGHGPFAPGSLILGYSRANCQRFIADWGLKGVALVPSVGRTGLTVCTGHAAKGAQADDVYLLPWGPRALERLDEREPSTLRLLYTMLTRARARVYVHPTMITRMT